MARTGTWIATALICTLTLSLAACASKQAKPTEAEPVQTGPVTLRFLGPSDPVYDPLINEFQRTHANIRVDRVTVPMEKRTSIEGIVTWEKEQIASGTLDVVYAEPDVMVGHLLPLDPFVQKSGFDLKAYGSADSLREQGKLYQLPLERRPYVLVYNKDLFAAANVPPPHEGWTWDEFRQTAQQLTGHFAAGGRQTWGFFAGQPVLVLNLYGGDRKAAIQFLSTLITGDKSMLPPEPGELVMTSDTPFYNGWVGMGLSSLGALVHRGWSSSWEFAPLPQHPGHPTEPIKVTAATAGIAAASKHPNEAWELLSFLAGPEGSELAAKQGALFSYQTPAAQEAWVAHTSPQFKILFTPQWAPFIYTPPKLTPEQSQQIAALGKEQMEAFRLAITDAARWEEHYAEYDRLGTEMFKLNPPAP